MRISARLSATGGGGSMFLEAVRCPTADFRKLGIPWIHHQAAGKFFSAARLGRLYLHVANFESTLRTCL